ncbi:MAG: hypothetical protein MUE40_11590 [Anaerolineae bacterium]|jgi:hypothetical protein|nr:hypothetical protein [Anaerolineae bacterium]
MTEPFLDRGLWSFWLAADPYVLEFVTTLSCILQPPFSPFQRRLQGRVLFSINPRYDHMEAWHWIRQTLDEETHFVELSERWENAILEAGQAYDEGSSPAENNA